GAFRTLTDKIAASPGAEKLIGATHLYLWDNGPIGAKDVRDWPGFLARLRTGAGLAERLRGVLEREAADLIRTVPAKPAPYQQRAIVAAFNAALTSLARREWQTEETDPAVIVGSHTKLR